MRISDWSSDVCSSDLRQRLAARHRIEVLDPDEEPTTVDPGEQPRQQCRAQVADVERPGRAGGEPPVGHGDRAYDRLAVPPPPLNRRDRLAQILERDGGTCVWCGRDVGGGMVRATTEHAVPRVKGGPSWLENEVAACGRCNRERGNPTPAEWLDVCAR